MLNRLGERVREWEPAIEAETALERTRRRYQQKRCVACGAPERYKHKAVCLSCWEAGQRFCTKCERVVSAEHYRHDRKCKGCHAAEMREYRARRHPNREGAKAAQLAAARRANEQRHRVSRARADEVHELRGRGWTWAEIARRFDTKPTLLQTLYSKHYYRGEPRVRPD